MMNVILYSDIGTFEIGLLKPGGQRYVDHDLHI